MKRHKMNRYKSKKSFSKSASVTHVKNTTGSRVVMRGGIRL